MLQPKYAVVLKMLIFARFTANNYVKEQWYQQLTIKTQQ